MITLDQSTSPTKPLPVPDAISAEYWRHASEGILAIQHCSACEAFTFPPLSHCPRCLGALQWRPVSGRGVIHSYCRMWEALVPGFTPPYLVVVVELADAPGVLITSNLVGDADTDLLIGQEVEVVFEQREGVALPQFRTVNQPAGGTA